MSDIPESPYVPCTDNAPEEVCAQEPCAPPEEVCAPEKTHCNTTVSVGNGRRVVSGSLRQFLWRR